jgi:hypothetical protein
MSRAGRLSVAPGSAFQVRSRPGFLSGQTRRKQHDQSPSARRAALA